MKNEAKRHRAAVALLALALTASAFAADTYDGADVLAKSRARYAAMRTYSDTGTVAVYERLPGGGTISERHSFSTLYQGPRMFLLQFQKDPKAGASRFVIWGDGEAFHTWWSDTKVHDTYPRGSGSMAFALGALPTLNAALAIPPLLFSQAGLHGSASDFQLQRAEGVEAVGGHRCYKLVGEVGLAYGTGTVTQARPTTLWVDADSLLVRKILEGTPKGSASGTVDEVTTTFEPQADPSIDPVRFKFSPPA
jgi:hypothetical protein